MEEYRRLRAQANTIAVDERQSLQALARDEKTSARTLSALEESFSGLEESKTKLESEITDLEEKKEEVRPDLSKLTFGLFFYGQVEGRYRTLQSDYSRAKQELNRQQSEFARISYVKY